MTRSNAQLLCDSWVSCLKFTGLSWQKRGLWPRSVVHTAAVLTADLVSHCSNAELIVFWVINGISALYWQHYGLVRSWPTGTEYTDVKVLLPYFTSLDMEAVQFRDKDQLQIEKHNPPLSLSSSCSQNLSSSSSSWQSSYTDYNKRTRLQQSQINIVKIAKKCTKC